MSRHGWLVALLLLFLAGCRQAPPQHTLVTGKVAYRGTPLRSGLIVFTPHATRGHSGEMAMGTISYDGSYTLQTGDKDGAVPGWYRVTVAALNGPSGVRLGDRSYSIPLSALPEKYRDPGLSKLECEVTTEKANIINFDLE